MRFAVLTSTDCVLGLTQAYLGKCHVCAVCPRPPLVNLHSSHHPINRSSLIGHPVHSRKRIKVVAIPAGLHGTDCEILCVDVFCPQSDSVMHCHGVIQVDVVYSDLYMDFFVRVKSIWRENDCLAS